MSDLLPITDRAAYMRANDRISELMNNCADDADRAELRALAEAQQTFYEANLAPKPANTDGVHEIAFALDMGKWSLELEDVLRAFGGPERFVEYMTRQVKLDDSTLEALVTECGLDRAELEKPFVALPGWDDISPEGQEPCDNPECCEPGVQDWRVVLSAMVGVNRDGQDVEDREGDLVLPYPAGRC